MSKSTAILPTALKTSTCEIHCITRRLPYRNRENEKRLQYQSCFLQDPYTYHANESLQLYLHFSSATSQTRESKPYRQGLVGGTHRHLLPNCHCNSIHQNLTRLFKNALSMTLLCWRSSTLSLPVTKEAKLTCSCCFTSCWSSLSNNMINSF